MLEAALPDEIIIEHHNLFPEGIEYDEMGKRFLLGSAALGTIYEVSDGGLLLPFIKSNDFQATFGIEIDRINNRLLVVNSSYPLSDEKLGAYDLKSGERIFMANLSDTYPNDKNLANDVAVDANGIAYVTDTFAPVIYRVDMNGEASIFIEDEMLSFINGIVAYSDEYLLLGAYPNLLLKIPLDKSRILKVTLEENIKFDVTDGMVLHPDGSLVTVTFPDSIIYRLRSDDNWVSAIRDAVSTGHNVGYGTTVAIRENDVYVIYSHLNYWMEDLGDQDIFEIVRVKFEEEQN